MDILVKQEQGRVPVTVFHLKGDLSTDDELQAQAKASYDSGMRNLLIDLTEVPFVSSIGLRALHSLLLLLRSNSPKESDTAMIQGIPAGTFTSPHLKLYNPSKQALQILKITGYDMFLEIYQDYQKALASFG